MVPSGYEPITFDEGLPIKLKVNRMETLRLRWHDRPEMLFILKGSFSLHTMQRTWQLSEGQMICLNSGALYTLDPTESDNLLVELQLDGSHFRVGPQHLSFQLDRFLDQQQAGNVDLSMMTQLMARLVSAYDKRPKGYEYQLVAFVQQMLAWLIRYDFLMETPPQLDQASEASVRVNAILAYMDEHSAEPLTLQQVADHEHLSYYYLSSILSKATGSTFRDHLTRIRLHKSLTDLCSTRDSIEMISAAHGFANARSYATLFARQYGSTPTAYREAYWQKNPSALEQSRLVDQADYEKVYALISKTQPAPLSAPELWLEKKEISLSLTRPSQGDTRRIWSVIATCSRAADLLRSDIQDLIRRIRREIGFQYIRFHGIFSDDMMICHREISGALRFNWVYVNQIFDFLVSIGMRPFLELSFMPSELASGDKTVFWYKANITPPRDLREWHELVYRLIRHCVNRYGMAEVRQWQVEVWSQPDYQDFFWTGTMQDYFQLYQTSVLAARQACPEISIGGPGITSVDYARSNWISSFTAFCQEQDIPLDFISFHVYSDHHAYMRRDTGVVPRHLSQARLRKDVERDIAETHIASAGTAAHRFHITEWNLSARYLFAVRDTIFMAPYVIHSVLSCMDLVDSMAFWTLSDLLDEVKLPLRVFHGGMGLFNAHGIPKPSYLAFTLLNRLGDTILGRGEGWIMTRQGDEIQILLYHLVFLDHLASQATDFSSEFTGNVYALFEEKPNYSYSIQLQDCLPKYRTRRYEINRKCGSAYDAWSAMGAVSELRSDEIAYLHAMAVPRMSVQEIEAENGVIHLDALLPPNGCQLIILEPVNHE